MDGGSRVAEVLRAHGVEFLFTLCGGHISPILVESKRRGIRIIDVRHEVNAVFAADAVARLTGRPGVAAVTAGPGVSNTITAIKNAQLAQSPLVLIGGATATILRGRGSLQDIDQMALIAPHVKWAARPDKLREVVPALEEAFRRAKDGVPGPVFVELAVDLLYAEETVREWYAAKTERPDKNLSENIQAFYIRQHLYRTFAEVAVPQIEAPRALSPARARQAPILKAIQKLTSAQRPVMVLGSQVMLWPERIPELVEAIEKLGIPVYLSGLARGLLGKGHPLQCRHKRRVALRESDLVLLCGVPSDFRLDYGAHVRRCHLISINLSGRDLKMNRRPDLGILADPCQTLIDIAGLAGTPPNREEWTAALSDRDATRDAEIVAMAGQEVEHINPIHLCQRLEAGLADDSLLVGDGGDFVATAAYTVSPRGPLSWLDPGVFGTLGVGAGFALGAKLVRPDADVWLLYGDGAAGFSMLEFDTFARHGLGVIALVGNDACWTQIARDQVVILEDDVGTNLAPTDYHVIAQGCGGHGIYIDCASQVDVAISEATAQARQGTPVLINARIGETDFRKGSISM
jgi:acetolactate synthase-like protein